MGGNTPPLHMVVQQVEAQTREKANAQAELIIELESSVDVQTVLTDTTNYAASVVDIVTNKELNNIKLMTKKLADYFTVQVVTMEALSTEINGGSNDTG